MLPLLKRAVDGKFRHRWHWLSNRRRWWKRPPFSGFLSYPTAWFCVVGWLNPAAFKIFHWRLCQCKCSFVRLPFVSQSTRPCALRTQGTWFAATRTWNQSPQSRDCNSDENVYRRRGKDGARWSSGAGKDDAMRVETGDGRQRVFQNIETMDLARCHRKPRNPYEAWWGKKVILFRWKCVQSTGFTLAWAF